MRRQKPLHSAVEVQIDDAGWHELGSPLGPAIKRAARRALLHAGESKLVAGLTILLTGDERVQRLNRQHRRKDRPTNVLSFSSRCPGYLGDIAIAYGVALRESDAAGLPLLDHTLHLSVHGVLHLLGYDHESIEDAAVMESLETRILAEMDIPDPYARQDTAA